MRERLVICRWPDSLST